MRRFRDFLLEAKVEYKQELSVERAAELIKAHCTDALKHADIPLVSGKKKATAAAYLLQGELGQRESANTSNHYTIIMDEVLPALGYPKRSGSIILGNYANLDYVEDYGTVYAILPFDGSPIGVCPRFDIWHTQVNIGASFDNLERWNEFFEGAGVPDYTFADMVTYLEEVLEDPYDSNFAKVSDVFVKGKVEKQLRAAFDPKHAGFQLAATKNIYTRFANAPRELWIGAKCVAVRLYDGT